MFVIIDKLGVIDVFFSDGEGYDGGEAVAQNAGVKGNGDSANFVSFVPYSKVRKLGVFDPEVKNYAALEMESTSVYIDVFAR